MTTQNPLTPEVAQSVTFSYMTKTDNPEIDWALQLREDHGIVYSKLVKLALRKLKATDLTDEEVALLKPSPKTGVSLTSETKSLLYVKAEAAGMTQEEYILSLIG